MYLCWLCKSYISLHVSSIYKLFENWTLTKWYHHCVWSQLAHIWPGDGFSGKQKHVATTLFFFILETCVNWNAFLFNYYDLYDLLHQYIACYYSKCCKFEHLFWYLSLWFFLLTNKLLGVVFWYIQFWIFSDIRNRIQLFFLAQANSLWSLCAKSDSILWKCKYFETCSSSTYYVKVQFLPNRKQTASSL